MTTKEALNYMTTDEIAEFMYNLFYERGENAFEYLRNEFPEFLDFVAEAFHWEETKQGHMYWSDIAWRQAFQEKTA